MTYKAEFTKEFLRTTKKLKKDMTLFYRLEGKIEENFVTPGEIQTFKR